MHRRRASTAYLSPTSSVKKLKKPLRHSLDQRSIELQALDRTLGAVLKAKEDLESVRGERLVGLLERSLARAAAVPR